MRRWISKDALISKCLQIKKIGHLNNKTKTNFSTHLIAEAQTIRLDNIIWVY